MVFAGAHPTRGLEGLARTTTANSPVATSALLRLAWWAQVGQQEGKNATGTITCYHDCMCQITSSPVSHHQKLHYATFGPEQLVNLTKLNTVVGSRAISISSAEICRVAPTVRGAAIVNSARWSGGNNRTDRWWKTSSLDTLCTNPGPSIVNRHRTSTKLKTC